MEFNSQQAQTTDYNMKFIAGDAQSFNQMEVMRKLDAQNKTKYENFKKRLEEFGKINTLEEAKTLAGKILPTANELNVFRVGNAKCTIINKEDNFRICLDTNEEFISYDFIK